MFLLVAPSTASRDKLQDSLLSACAHSPGQICPFELHQILISTHHENWRRYIADLEKYLQYQVSRYWSNYVILLRFVAVRSSYSRKRQWVSDYAIS